MSEEEEVKEQNNEAKKLKYPKRTKKPVTLKKGKVYLPELFEMIGKCRSKQDRIKLLHDYANKDNEHKKLLQYALECTYHPKVIFALPAGTPPYKQNSAPDFPLAQSNLFNTFKKIHMFLECRSKVSPSIKREQIFLQTLESLHPKEADLFCMIKDGDITGYRGVNRELFQEAFPQWVPEI